MHIDARFARRAAAGAAVLAMAAACATVRTPADLDREHARTLRPAALADGARPGAASAVKQRVRAWADADYRAQHLHWEPQIRAQLARASALLSAEVGVQLDLQSVEAWDHADGANDLGAALEELAAVDPGADVDLVVGFVAARPALPVTHEQLGKATAPGRHLVLRAMESADEWAQLRAALRHLSENEVDALARDRRLHREAVVFAHEWAHTVGADHDPGDEFILSPRYTPYVSRFSPQSAALLARALAGRGERAAALAGVPGGAAPAVQAPSAPAAAAPVATPASLTRSPSPAQQHAARLDEVAEVFHRTGDVERAWTLLAPLVPAHADDARTQHWACYLAAQRQPRARTTLETCDAAARLPGALPEVHLAHARLRLERGDRRAALAAMGDAEAAFARSPPDDGAWSYLASLYAAAESCAGARRAAAKIGDGAAARAALGPCATPR